MNKQTRITEGASLVVEGRTFDELFRQGRFADADEKLKAIDVEKQTTVALLFYLMTTKPAKDRLHIFSIPPSSSSRTRASSSAL